jgi:hypothetical protein
MRCPPHSLLKVRYGPRSLVYAIHRLWIESSAWRRGGRAATDVLWRCRGVVVEVILVGQQWRVVMVGRKSSRGRVGCAAVGEGGGRGAGAAGMLWCWWGVGGREGQQRWWVCRCIVGAVVALLGREGSGCGVAGAGGHRHHA